MDINCKSIYYQVKDALFGKVPIEVYDDQAYLYRKEKGFNRTGLYEWEDNPVGKALGDHLLLVMAIMRLANVGVKMKPSGTYKFDFVVVFFST